MPLTISYENVGESGGGEFPTKLEPDEKPKFGRTSSKQQPGCLSFDSSGVTIYHCGDTPSDSDEESNTSRPNEPEQPTTPDNAENALDALSPRPGRINIATVLTLMLISVIRNEQNRRLTLGETRQIYMNISLKMADFEREMKMEAAQEKYGAAIAESAGKIVSGAVELACSIVSLVPMAMENSAQKQLEAKRAELEDLKSSKTTETPGAIKIDVKKSQEDARATDMQERKEAGADAEVSADQKKQIQQNAENQAKEDAEQPEEVDEEMEGNEKQEQKATENHEQEQHTAEEYRDIKAREAKLEKEIKDLEDNVKHYQAQAHFIGGIGSSLGGISHGSFSIVAAGDEQKSAILTAEAQRLEATREQTQRVGQGTDESIGLSMQNINSLLSSIGSLLAAYYGASQSVAKNI